MKPPRPNTAAQMTPPVALAIRNARHGMRFSPARNAANIRSNATKRPRNTTLAPCLKNRYCPSLIREDAGATVIAHTRAKERLTQLKDPHTVIPDETVDKTRNINLGGTTLELHYLGLNHSDSTLVMRLPKEKVVFIVDTIPVGSVPGRGFIDIYPLETEEFIKQVLAMDWERMIPGHPGQPDGRLGTKQDAQ